MQKELILSEAQKETRRQIVERNRQIKREKSITSTSVDLVCIIKVN